MILKRRYVIRFSPTKTNSEQRKLYMVDTAPVRYVPFIRRAKLFLFRQDARRVLRKILKNRSGNNPYWRHDIVSRIFMDEGDGEGWVPWESEDEPERSEPTGMERPHPAHQDVPSRSQCNTGGP